jgi:hypothetical protein
MLPCKRIVRRAPRGSDTCDACVSRAGAALVGNLTAIRKLLERQASASKSSNMLRTPLHFAAQEVIYTGVDVFVGFRALRPTRCHVALC